MRSAFPFPCSFLFFFVSFLACRATALLPAAAAGLASLTPRVVFPRLALRSAAVRLGQLAKYRSAGTVEFVVDDDTGQCARCVFCLSVVLSWLPCLPLRLAELFWEPLVCTTELCTSPP